MTRDASRDANDTDNDVIRGEKPQQVGIQVETAARRVDSTKNDTKVLDKRESLSAYFTIAAAAFGLISDGYQNNLMTMSNVVFKTLYPKDYTTSVSTRVSNALLVGAIIGQVFVGLICDRIGRKVALVATTLLIIVGATIGTAAHGANGNVQGLFWALTFARGITGVGVGGEYPASSTSASEAANEKMIKQRGPVFIMVTNFVLSVRVSCILEPVVEIILIFCPYG